MPIFNLDGAGALFYIAAFVRTPSGMVYCTKEGKGQLTIEMHNEGKQLGGFQQKTMG